MLVQDASFDEMAAKMAKAYNSIRVGDPLDPNTLVGPLKTKT